jgi:protein-tyrosine-phosphatase
VRVLFVCRGNICRSRVAEEIFQVLSWSVGGRGDHEARSAGVDPDSGGRLVTGRDVAWADVICVMEGAHAAYIQKHWPGQAREVRVLGIPDVYEPDDEELRDRLTEVVRALLAEGSAGGATPGGRSTEPYR